MHYSMLSYIYPPKHLLPIQPIKDLRIQLLFGFALYINTSNTRIKQTKKNLPSAPLKNPGSFAHANRHAVTRHVNTVTPAARNCNIWMRQRIIVLNLLRFKGLLAGERVFEQKDAVQNVSNEIFLKKRGRVLKSDESRRKIEMIYLDL